MDRRVSKIPGRGLPPSRTKASLPSWFPRNKLQCVSDPLQKDQSPSHCGSAELSDGVSGAPGPEAREAQVKNSRRLFPRLGSTKTTRRRVGPVTSRSPAPGPPPATRGPRDGGGRELCPFRSFLLPSKLSLHRVHWDHEQFSPLILWWLWH